MAVELRRPEAAPADEETMEMEVQLKCVFGREHGEQPRWTAADKAVKRQMVDYLNRSCKVKVEAEELDYYMIESNPE